jgi:serine/threonine protein kinase
MDSGSEQTSYAGRYRLLELAGRGGMAKVWRAEMLWAAGFSREVAVKQISPSLTANKTFLAMFLEEARIGSTLQHPNIVQILDFGVDRNDAYYMVMEWVNGIDLRRYQEGHGARGEVTPWELIAAIGVEALRGLGAAHERLDSRGQRAPVVHRDVTPQNILIGLNGIVKLTDFGLSRAKDRARITDPNIIKGKLGYLAPEVAWGEEATAQSDIFSLGIALWEALTGRRLYEGQTDLDVFQCARKANIRPLQQFRHDVPKELCSCLKRALATKPEHRYPSTRGMLRDLTRLLRWESQPTDAQAISDSVSKARQALGLSPNGSLPGEVDVERAEVAHIESLAAFQVDPPPIPTDAKTTDEDKA